jgi:hypothetical protein
MHSTWPRRFLPTLLASAVLCWSVGARARTYFYRVEENDQLGVIVYSLGHTSLWDQVGAVNFFKDTQRLAEPNQIYAGSIFKIQESDIVFKDNVQRRGKWITFKKKIRTRAEFAAALALRPKAERRRSAGPLRIGVVKRSQQSQKLIRPANQFATQLYLGGGGFIARNAETAAGVRTESLTGLQPMAQVKGIFTATHWGSVSLDAMAKKILNAPFDFPVNFDYRLQLLPRWSAGKNLRFAVSLSEVRHSYVGKAASEDIAVDLRSRFAGLGVVIPQEKSWFELYVEKAFDGRVRPRGEGAGKSATGGYRVDTEYVSPFAGAWFLIPGLNYYALSTNNDYRFHVIEARLTFAREFTW